MMLREWVNKGVSEAVVADFSKQSGQNLPWEQNQNRIKIE